MLVIFSGYLMYILLRETHVSKVMLMLEWQEESVAE